MFQTEWIQLSIVESSNKPDPSEGKLYTKLDDEEPVAKSMQNPRTATDMNV